MEKPINKYITITYQLFSVEGDSEHLVEEATEERPFLFISGFGIALEALEQHVANLERGEEFDFILEPEQAYGLRDEEKIIEVPKSNFDPEGNLTPEHYQPGTIVPLENEEGMRFYGRILSADGDIVKLDLNHPQAGLKLHYKGSVVESREASMQEIQNLINHLYGGGDCEGCSQGHCGHCH